MFLQFLQQRFTYHASMDLPETQLETLLAIAEEGTFDAAARRLRLTPSAVSQRIRALEAAVGQVVVRRTTPARPTGAGEVLLRLARQHQLLRAEAAAELGRDGAGTGLAVAVNADSLATWFRDVVGEVATWRDVSLSLSVEDQEYSAGLLRRGDVLGAVTSDPGPLQGCRTKPLGAMRYLPVAAPGLVGWWREEGGHDWAALPVVTMNEKDELQHRWLRSRTSGEPAVVHRVPTSADFAEALRRGLGWGLLPELQLEGGLADGSLETLVDDHLDVPLHWVRWRLASPLLDRLGAAVEAAAAVLRGQT